MSELEDIKDLIRYGKCDDLNPTRYVTDPLELENYYVQVSGIYNGSKASVLNYGQIEFQLHLIKKFRDAKKYELSDFLRNKLDKIGKVTMFKDSVDFKSDHAFFIRGQLEFGEDRDYEDVEITTAKTFQRIWVRECRKDILKEDKGGKNDKESY